MHWWCMCTHFHVSKWQTGQIWPILWHWSAWYKINDQDQMPTRAVVPACGFHKHIRTFGMVSFACPTCWSQLDHSKNLCQSFWLSEASFLAQLCRHEQLATLYKPATPAVHAMFIMFCSHFWEWNLSFVFLMFSGSKTARSMALNMVWWPKPFGWPGSSICPMRHLKNAAIGKHHAEGVEPSFHQTYGCFQK